MAKVQISDLFQAELWTNDIINEAPELKNLLNTGLFVTSSELERVVNSVEAGSRFELPYIDEPDYTEPEAMDDSDDEVTTNKINWDNQFAVLGLYSKSYKFAHIASLVARDSDPAKVIRNLIGNYWGRDLQRRIIASITGIAQKAGSDLTLDVADDSEDGDDVLLSNDIIIDGASLLGDYQDKFEYMFIHSKVYSDLKKQNLIETIPPSEEGAKPIEVWGNYRIFVNDLMPIIEGDNKKKYVSLIVQRGIFAYSDKKLSSDMPLLELYRNPLTGKGAGDTTIISRKGFVLHPVGWSFLKSINPKLDDLKNKDNWSKKFKTKQHRFVRIITN